MTSQWPLFHSTSKTSEVGRLFFTKHCIIRSISSFFYTECELQLNAFLYCQDKKSTVLIVTAIFDGELPCTHNATKSLDNNWNYENYSMHRGKSYNFFCRFHQNFDKCNGSKSYLMRRTEKKRYAFRLFYQTKYNYNMLKF